MKIRRNLVSRIRTLLMIRRHRPRGTDGKNPGDWQDLSPESPPLPDLELSMDAHKTFVHQEVNIQIQAVYNRSGNTRLHNLYTIPEESEMSCSNNNRRHGRMRSNSTSSPRQSDDGPTSQASATSTSSGGLFFGPPMEWAKEQYHTSDTANGRTLAGDEQSCKLRLVAMAAVLHDMTQKNNLLKDRPVTRTEVSFDENDNVCHFQTVQPSGTSEPWRFRGNTQFIPPEIAEPGIYDPSLAEVWTMGICLYRMLTGKYPFIAENDRSMFSKMVRTDLTIPQGLSEGNGFTSLFRTQLKKLSRADAKDLLRKMLAPYQTRASFDAVLFHPWLKLHTSHCVGVQPRKPRSNFAPGRLLVRAAKLLVHGPYPPPKRPYQELISQPSASA